MDELGVQLIFAQSPQAKGRVERAAGTFQDRLVTELRLAGAITIDDANRVLEGFLPRFNNRFKVPAREQEVAYRAVDDGMRLDRVLCFKYRRRVARDNTVRYRWRTLQLLPGKDRPTYAGAAVNVLEGLDDSLAVQHRGTHRPLTGSATTSECPPGLRRENHALTHHPISPPMVWVANGRPSWRLWMPTTMPSSPSPPPVATVLDEFAKLWVHGAGSPRRCRRPGGRRCRGRSERVCPCVGSPGSWVYTETR